MSLYTLIAIVTITAGSSRPTSVVVPNLSYQECSNQVNNLKMASYTLVNMATCALQSDK